MPKRPLPLFPNPQSLIPTFSLRPVPVLQPTFEEIDGVGEIAERLATFSGDVLGVGLLLALVVIACPIHRSGTGDEPTPDRLDNLRNCKLTFR